MSSPKATMAVGATRLRTDEDLDRSLVGWLAGATAIAAALELLLLRTFTRTAIHIPGFADGWLYGVASESARFAYYLAVVLVAVTLLALLVRALGFTDRLGVLGLGGFLIAAGAARLGALGETLLAVAVVATALLLTPGAAIRLGRRGHPALLMFAGAFALSGLHSASQLAISESIAGPVATSWLLLASEVLAVGAALATVLLWHPPVPRNAVAAGVGVAAAVSLVFAASPSTINILLLWNFGLTGGLPMLIYGVAFGAVAYTLVRTAQMGERRLLIGLTLVIMGGVGLHSTYQTALVLAGLGLIGATASRQGAHAPDTKAEL